MNYPMLLLIIACFLCGGALDPRKPKRLEDKSLAESSPAVADNSSKIWKQLFQKHYEAVITLIRVSWNKKMRGAKTIDNWAFKYVVTKLKMGIATLEKINKTLRDLKRRREEAVRKVFLLNSKRRQLNKLRAIPSVKLTYENRPLPGNKPNRFLLNLAEFINATTEQRFLAPKNNIVAIM